MAAEWTLTAATAVTRLETARLMAREWKWREISHVETAYDRYYREWESAH